MPLHLAELGIKTAVAAIHGPSEIRMKLADLGFLPGTPIYVVSRDIGGVMVRIRNSKIFLNNLMACYVQVQ